jgi:hypothetical protein
MPKSLFAAPSGKGAAIHHYLLLAALLLAAGTYWATWVDHDAAALRLTGQDMGEFVKFLPTSQEATRTWDVQRQRLLPGFRMPRQLFYVPPFVCTVCLTLLAVNQHLAYPRWLRATVLACAALLLLGLLPPAWGHPNELFTGDFRLQGYTLILGFGLVLGHGLFRKIPLHLLALAVCLLSLSALATGQGAFWLIRPRLWAAYNTPTLFLGWGLWLHIAAWAAAVGLGAYIHRRERRLADKRPSDAGPRIKEISSAR